MNARTELDGLLNEAIEMAVRLLEKHGTHIPFAMAITVGGERINIAADDSIIRDPQILLDQVLRQLKLECSKLRIRAVALADNVEFTSYDNVRSAGIRVTLDHLSGDENVTCILPYSLNENVFSPGEFFAIDPQFTFFLDPRK